MLFYKLKSDETIIAKNYNCYLNHLVDKIELKKLFINNMDKEIRRLLHILLHNESRLHTFCTLQTIFNLGWKVLLCAYLFDLITTYSNRCIF